MLSYQKILAARNKHALVFENDPFFLGDFVKMIEAVAKEADTLPPGFIISLENTTPGFSLAKDRRRVPGHSSKMCGSLPDRLESCRKYLKLD